MIAGLISPPVESPGQESDNDSLPGQGYTSSHASSDDEQSAILLLDDSTSSSHANQRRQARHPSDARPTHSDPTAEDPGNIALSLILRPANDHGVPATHGRSSRWNLFNALGMHGRRTTCATYPIPFCLRWLHRTQYGLGRRSIQTVGANAYPTATLQTALLIRQIGGPRASRLLLCVMPAERTLMHAQMRHCVSPRSCSWHPPWTNKTAISVPQHAKFSLRDYRPTPRPG